MKVGTITFHRAINYGAVLQTYALQKALEKLKIENEVIDYRPKYLEWIYKPLSMRNVKNPKDFFAVLKGAYIKGKKRKMFLSFIKNKVKTSSKPYKRKELDKTNYIYDKFIAGSDQVWNFDCSGYDRAYFLDFVDDSKKKYSYSASFGFYDIPDEDKAEYEELLKDYKKISVRENQGVKIIKDLLKIECEEVIDPTLLLDNQEWNKIAKHTKKNEKYILIYALKPSEYLLRFAAQLSEETGLKIFFVKDSLTKENNIELTKNIEYIKMATPEEFIGLVMDASYIITNSFHGTAFSINFNKQFYTELLPPELNVNSRLENILDMFSLRGRELTAEKEIHREEINYDIINKELAIRRKKSYEFLESIISDVL